MSQTEQLSEPSTKILEISGSLRLEARIEHGEHRPDKFDRTVNGVAELMTELEMSMQAVRSDWAADISEGG